jgi:hypothetical protein
MGSIIHTKGITSKNGLISSEIGRGGQDFFYTLYFQNFDKRFLNFQRQRNRQLMEKEKEMEMEEKKREL